MLRLGVEGIWKKIEEISLFILLCLVPTQLGKHFWPLWSYVDGARIDYLSPTVYVVDILWVVLVLSRVFQFGLGIKRKEKNSFQFLILGVLMIVNVLVSENKMAAIYKWVRFGQWWWFFVYCWDNKRVVSRKLKMVVPIWVVSESVLGLAQMIKGENVGGLMWWFGERRFNYTTIGIAQMSVWGQGVLRAYGTFSHPNSLAGFILVSLAWWLKMGVTEINKKRLGRIGWWIVLWFGLVGILVSGSRTIWVLTFGLMGGGFLKMFKGELNSKKMIGYLTVLMGLTMLIVGMMSVNYRTGDFLGGWDRDSWSKRMELNIAAVRMWKENLMIGVGAGNFIPNLNSYQTSELGLGKQPAHNILLLAGSEIGVLGIMGVFWMMSEWIERKNWKKKWWLWGLVVLSGMMDHYWLTLPQNTWLLAIILGTL